MTADTSTPVLVVDVETTGLDPSADRIVEIEVVGVDFERRCYRRLFHSLVDPEIPFRPKLPLSTTSPPPWSPGKALSLARIRPALEALADPAIPFAAHNAGFDSAFLKPAVPAWTAPWTCTLRIARHLWPDAPSHGNQALRYRLDLNVPATIRRTAPWRRHRHRGAPGPPG